MKAIGKIERVCPTCGKTFYPHISNVKLGRGIFCSHKCHMATRKPESIEKVCQYCNDQFSTSRKDQKFCSVKCLTRANHDMNPDGINIGNQLEHTCCPVTPTRLRDMYWKEGKGIKEIARIFTQMRGHHRRIGADDVKRWLLLCGVTLRTRGEAQSLSHRQNPQRVAKCVEAMQKHRKPTSPNDFHRNKLWKLGHKAQAKNRTTRLITKQCSLPGCSNLVTRLPCRMKGSVFCSHSHASKYRHLRDKEIKENALLKARAEAMLGRSLP
jgi:hypothetical protein